MKVVQVLPALQGGGVERGTLEIAGALVAGGHESLVLSAGGRMVAELERSGSRHVTWPLGRKHPAVALEVRRLRRWLARARPDILHVRSRVPAWLCWLAWRRMAQGQRPRFVTTLHGLHSVSPFSAVMARGERVIVVSDTAKRYLLDNYVRPGAPALRRTRLTMDRVQRIYRGIDPSRYHRGYRPCDGWLADWQRDFPILQGRRMVLLSGRLTRLKGHEDFPILMEHLCERHPDAIGVVVGGEEERSRAYAASIRDASPGIVFTGHRTDLREIMAAASAVVSLSNRPESFGRVALEALSLGVPVVGYDHGGVAEILEQVFPEGRVPTGRPAEAANRLASMFDDEAGARSRIRDHDFTLQRMCRQTLALYEELAANAWKR
ncbi:MAG: glycosyltransferase family 4 protein [Gammaproteobacteria bacterium]|nr:glycosyltransferase [Gammaproteobacteria bacterium]MXY52442.1 glycosyltransferase family 4 protein [Gammaproteobacteria bacterium]MYB38237.1 glycosyltransferase family 4 protein [Gammaproteobacteria bacterium]